VKNYMHWKGKVEDCICLRTVGRRERVTLSLLEAAQKVRLESSPFLLVYGFFGVLSGAADC
jgi:hypothetical protein